MKTDFDNLWVFLLSIISVRTLNFQIMETYLPKRNPFKVFLMDHPKHKTSETISHSQKNLDHLCNLIFLVVSNWLILWTHILKFMAFLCRSVCLFVCHMIAWERCIYSIKNVRDYSRCSQPRKTSITVMGNTENLRHLLCAPTTPSQVKGLADNIH